MTITIQRNDLRADKIAFAEQLNAAFPGLIAGASYDDVSVSVDAPEATPEQADSIREFITAYRATPAPPEIPALQPRLDALYALTAQKGVLQHDELKQALSGLVGVLRDLVVKLGLE